MMMRIEQCCTYLRIGSSVNSMMSRLTDSCHFGETGQGEKSVVIIDKRNRADLSSILNIAQTIFVVLLLGVGALLFSKDANDLVLMPIERMIRKVKDVSLNPLASNTEDFLFQHDTSHHGAQMEVRPRGFQDYRGERALFFLLSPSLLIIHYIKRATFRVVGLISIFKGGHHGEKMSINPLYRPLMCSRRKFLKNASTRSVGSWR